MHVGKKKKYNDNKLSHFPGNHITCGTVKTGSGIVNNKCTWLGPGDVMSRAKQIPEEEIENYLATIPQFYQQRSTILTDLGKLEG
jgi:hypothetical protein